MALFKILQGPSSRIGTDITPLHEGYAYFTPDTSGFYIDAQVNGELQRIQINPLDYVLEQNNGEQIKFWRGTKAEYDAIATKDDSVLYLVTEESGSTLADNSGTFVAVYDETTAEEIYAASQDGKAVFCVNGSAVGMMMSCTATVAYFVQLNYAEYVSSYQMFTVRGSAWSSSIIELQEKIYEGGILKGDGSGSVMAAEAGVDYAAPDHTHDVVVEGNHNLEQKFWRGTKAEYDAINEKDDSVLYIITDDNESGETVDYMKTEFYDADSVVKDAGGIAAFVQAKVDGVTVSSLGAAAAEHTHTASEVGADASGAATQALTDAKAYTDTAVAGKANSSHTHDDRYYTESEVDAKLATKAEITYGTDDLTAGESVLATGQLYCVYE